MGAHMEQLALFAIPRGYKEDEDAGSSGAAPGIGTDDSSDKQSQADSRPDYEDQKNLIDKKIRSGQTKAVEAAETPPRPKREGKVIDIMHLLQQSVKQARRKEEPARRRKAS